MLIKVCRDFLQFFQANAGERQPLPPQSFCFTVREQLISFNKIFSGTELRHFVAGRDRRFGNHICPHHQGSDVTGYPERSLYRGSSHMRTLMMGAEMVPETSVSSCNQLTRLCAREDFIEFSRHETFKLCS
jgi:hypothetical protein